MAKEKVISVAPEIPEEQLFLVTAAAAAARVLPTHHAVVLRSDSSLVEKTTLNLELLFGGNPTSILRLDASAGTILVLIAVPATTTVMVSTMVATMTTATLTRGGRVALCALGSLLLAIIGRRGSRCVISRGRVTVVVAVVAPTAALTTAVMIRLDSVGRRRRRGRYDVGERCGGGRRFRIIIKGNGE